MNVPSGGVTFLVVFAAALVYFAISFARTGHTSVPETKDREVRWVEGRARILDVKIVKEVQGVIDPSTYTSRSAYAVVRTADGREITGWTGDLMSGFSRSCVGREYPAWYDPEDPSRFSLRRPSVTRERVGYTGVVVGFLGAAVVLIGIVVLVAM